MSHRSLTDACVHCSRDGGGDSTSLSLLKLAASGQEEAWRRLRELYSPLIFYWCRRFGLSNQDIVDVGQDVFLALSRNLASFKHENGPGSFRRWLHSIVRTKAIDWFRRSATQPLAEGGSDALVRLVNTPVEEAEPQEETENERAILVRQAVDTIAREFPEWYKAAFFCLMIDDMAAEDVAGRFGVSTGAVYTVKSRMLKRLRLELEGLLE